MTSIRGATDLRQAPATPTRPSRVVTRGGGRAILGGFALIAAVSGGGVFPAAPAHAAEQAATSASSPSSAASLRGRWEGTMEMGVQSVRIRVSFDGRNGGSFQIVGVTTDRNPLTAVALRGDRVSFSLQSSPPQTFTGRLSGDTIRGTSSLAGYQSPFRLERVRE